MKLELSLVVILLFQFFIVSGICQPEKRSQEIPIYDPPGSGVMSVTGGYVRQLSVPEGIEDFQWGDQEFEISFSVRMDQEGKVTGVERIEYDDALKQAWKVPFEKSCSAAIKNWRFKPTRNRRGEAVASGTPIHIKFQRNKTGDTNIEINDGGGVILRTNSRFEK